jgi:hypothetical protein
MAYSGPIPVSTLDNLLAALVAWAVANAGFTDAGTTAPPAGRTTTYMYRLSKGGRYWYFMGDDATVGGLLDGYIEMRTQSALPTAANYNSTAVGPQRITRAQLWRQNTGPYVAYNFFTDGTSVHVVVETVTGVFCHFSFGNIVKFGTWTGGEYTMGFYSSEYSGGFNYDTRTEGLLAFDGYYGTSTTIAGNYMYTPDAVPYGDYRDYSKHGYTENNKFFRSCGYGRPIDLTNTIYHFMPAGYFWIVGANMINQRAPMIPMICFIHDHTLDKLWMAGYAGHVRGLNMTYLQIKEIVQTEWEVFPCIQRDGGSSLLAPISHQVAYAYRRA